MRFSTKITVMGLVILFASMAAMPAMALYVPNKLFAALYTDYQDMLGTTVTTTYTNTAGTTTNNLVFQNIAPFPSSYSMAETNITGSGPELGQPNGIFERNEHQIKFATDGETANGQATGHKFLRSDAWDFAFDMKLQTPRPDIRKEMGVYIKSPIGNSIFDVVSNDTFYGTGPGTIGVIQTDVLPNFQFSNTGGPLGDYNHNGTVDAADYTIWRDTLGSTTDLRANGNNDPPSTDLIDQADYTTWKNAFGQGPTGPNLTYHSGDTLRLRMIYTPPVLNANTFDPNNPGANVATAGKMEYRVSVNGGSVVSSGPLDMTNSWMGIPDGTLIGLRIQNIGTQSVVNDSSTVTFNNFDLNGDLPGTGFGAGAGSIAGVPEPSSVVLLGIALATIGVGKRYRRS